MDADVHHTNVFQSFTTLVYVVNTLYKGCLCSLLQQVYKKLEFLTRVGTIDIDKKY